MDVVTPPPGQEYQSTDPKDYQIRIIVAGTRDYDNRREFHNVLCLFLERFEGKPLLFVSGAAPSGADDMIIRWCKKFKYPCLEMPADWDNPEYKTRSGKSRAGFVRNTEMAKIGTHLLAFHDGHSHGTKHMIEEAQKFGLMTKEVYIKLQEPTEVYATSQGQ